MANVSDVLGIMERYENHFGPGTVDDMDPMYQDANKLDLMYFQLLQALHNNKPLTAEEIEALFPQPVDDRLY